MISPETRPPHPPPSLFGPYGLVFLFGITLVAARLGAPWVALLAGCLLLVGLAARLWARYALAGLVYTRRGSATRGDLLVGVGQAPTDVPRRLVPDDRPLRAFCGDTLVLET